MENQWCSKAGAKLQKSKRKISVKGQLFRDVVNRGIHDGLNKSQTTSKHNCKQNYLRARILSLRANPWAFGIFLFEKLFEFVTASGGRIKNQPKQQLFTFYFTNKFCFGICL